VVFFENHAALWPVDSPALLHRRLLVHHLRQVCYACVVFWAAPLR
jgi:hypothetical protein